MPASEISQRNTTHRLKLLLPNPKLTRTHIVASHPGESRRRKSPTRCLPWKM